MKLYFRPHHFLCTLGFVGRGYSAPFVANFTQVTELLNSNEGDNTCIDVIAANDTICQPCPNNLGKYCKQEAKITALDTAHARIHGLHPGTSITWGEAKETLKQAFTLENFATACASCEWQALGTCEAALKKLQKEK